MKNNFIKKYSKLFSIVLGIILLISIWDILAYTVFYNEMDEFFITVYKSILLLGKKETLKALGYTFVLLFFSLLISLLTGLIFGSLTGYYKCLFLVLNPIISVIKSFPLIGIILLLLSKFKYYEILVTGSVLFPLIFYQVSNFTEDTKDKYNDYLKIEGKKNLFEVLSKVILPLNKNKILLVLLQSIGMGLKVEIMSETFGYSNNQYGIGKLIYQSYSALQYKEMMGYIMLCLIIILTVDSLVTLFKRNLKLY